MKRNLKRLGLVVLGLVILMLCASGIAGIVFTRQLNAEIAAIKAKGEPLTWEQLLGKPIPASENAADVCDAMRRKELSGAYKSDYEVVDRVISLHGAPIDAATRRKLAEAIAHAQPLLDLTAEAVSKPRYQRYPDPATGNPDFQNLAVVRNMCRLLSARSVLHAQSHDMDAAVGDVCLQFRLAAQIEEGSSYIAQLARIAIMSIASDSARHLVRYGGLSEQQARRLYDAAERIDVAQGFRRSWLGERVLFLYLSDPSRVRGVIGSMASGPTSPPVTVPDPVGAVYTKTVLKGDEAAYLKVIARQLDALNLSYPKARSSGVLNEPDLPVYAIFSKMLSPTFVTGGIKRYDAEAVVASTQVFLALQAYKAQHGGYPASMQELKSKLGWKLPTDPFSGKDFIYKPQAKGFILYSVGPDMKDDGGRAIPGDSVQIESKGDIVLKWDK